MEDEAPAVVPLEKIVRAFLRIRDRRTEIKRAFEDEDNGLKAAQDILDAHMLNQMHTQGVTSFRTNYGTAYITETIKPTASDWSAFYKWVAENDAFDFLEKRIKSTSVSEYMSQNDGDTPPGVSVLRRNEVNVRRTN